MTAVQSPRPKASAFAPSRFRERSQPSAYANAGRLFELIPLSQRQFWLSAAVAAPVGFGRCCRRADEAPADRGGLLRLLADHQLGRAAWPVIAGEEHAVLQVHAILERLERPDLAVGQH